MKHDMRNKESSFLKEDMSVSNMNTSIRLSCTNVTLILSEA